MSKKTPKPPPSPDEKASQELKRAKRDANNELMITIGELIQGIAGLAEHC